MITATLHGQHVAAETTGFITKKQFSESGYGKASLNTNKAPSYYSMQKYSKIVHIIDKRQSRWCTLFRRKFKEANEEENHFS